MEGEIARAIAQAYRWQRRLGAVQIASSHCHIVVDPAHPDVWDSNHADEVTAQTDAEIDAVFAAMDEHLGHTSWRVIHADAFTPDVFLARLALDDFEVRNVTIQMALRGMPKDRGARIELRPVVGHAEWSALSRLVLANHAEGRTTSGVDVPAEITAGLVSGYRAKSRAYHFHLVVEDGAPVAYGAYAAAPDKVGMIEDLFTLPSARQRGVATAMIAAFVDRLLWDGCQTVFIGALAAERPKHLYARLGFRPVGIARTWVKRAGRGE
jgi:GNAT superfamily N-acetyltransferase